MTLLGRPEGGSGGGQASDPTPAPAKNQVNEASAKLDDIDDDLPF
jgi:hypothetical protein